VGVVLIASPSIGSIYADRFDLLTQIYANELGGVLRRHSTLLGNLDDRFSDFVAKKKKHIPNLTGAEACEHRLILRRKLLDCSINCSLRPRTSLSIRLRQADTSEK
jgi:hypothetical protein